MICGAPVTMVSALSPSARAVAVVMSLKVEPGGCVCWVERLSSGAFSSFCRASKVASAASESLEETASGS